MPQDGSNNYQYPPGTPGIPDQTIESEAYNTFLDDLVVNDLNIARPVHRGGTGGTNAYDARQNLDIEVAAQLVTNYDLHVWEAGSFYSTGTATAQPTAHAYVGVALLYATPDYMALEARNVFDGTRYTRIKAGGVWGAWIQQTGTQAQSDARYVNVTGDTMTGALTLAPPSGTSAVLNLVNTGAADADIIGAHNNLVRWVVRLGNTDTETGSNSGSNFNILGLNDAGAGVTPAQITINRATGAFTSVGELTAPTYNVTTGGKLQGDATGVRVFSPSLNTKVQVTNGHIYFDSSGHSFRDEAGGTVKVFINATGEITAPRYYLTSGGGLQGDTGFIRLYSPNLGQKIQIGNGNVYHDSDNHTFRNAAGTERFVLNALSLDAVFTTDNFQIGYPGLGVAPLTAQVAISYAGGGSQFGMTFRPSANDTNPIIFCNAAASVVGSIVTSAAATSYNTTSDERLKEDLKTFDAGNIVDATEVYDFKWKSTGERAYGVIAQQAVTVYPTPITHIEANKEKGTDEWWGVDYSKYVPVLLQELKALRARVAALEGGGAARPT